MTLAKGSQITRRAWTAEEDAALRRAWSSDLPLHKIAASLKRQSGSLHARAKLLELPARPPGTTKVYQSMLAMSRRAREEDDYFNMRRAGVSAAQTREVMGLSKGRAEQLGSWYLAQTRSVAKDPPAHQGPTNDDRYVAACLAQGGFVYATVIDGETVHVRPAAAA